MLGELFKKKQFDFYEEDSISGRDIHHLFTGVKHILTTDRDYSLVKEGFLVGKGYKGFRKWLGASRLFNWTSQWDCDNFAAAYQLYMAGLHAKHGHINRKKTEGIAVGEMFYITNMDPSTGQGGGGHAINVAIAKKGEFEYEKIYIEPQNGRILHLTQEEEDSCWYVKF